MVRAPTSWPPRHAPAIRSPLFEPLLRSFRAHAAMGYQRGVRVVPPALGAEAGLLAAGALVLADYWNVPEPERDEDTG